LIQIVHFYESNADNDVLATHDRGVVTRWESCNDRRLAWLSRGMPAVLDSADLVSSDDAADYCMLPVIIRANQCLSAVVQFQCRISQCIGKTILSELRPSAA